MAIQMIAIILIGVFGSIQLDKFLELSFPIFTIIGSMAAVVLSIYYIVKDFIK